MTYHNMVKPDIHFKIGGENYLFLMNKEVYEILNRQEKQIEKERTPYMKSDFIE